MRFKLLNVWLKQLVLPLLSLGILGLEPGLYSFIGASRPLYENPKLVMDTRAQVNLIYKHRIFSYLDQVAPQLNRQYKRQLVQLICSEGQDQGLDPQLLTALIEAESSFRNDACSRVGARGLMQLRLATAKEIARELGLSLEGTKSLHEPHLNIKMGTYYLAKMLQRFEDLELALTAYNIGPTAVRRLIVCRADIPLRYSRKVLKNYWLIRQTKERIL